MNIGAERRAIVILGMHRSGTSACARAVSLCGYAVPQDLMLAQPDNPKGFWESVAVVRLNDAILKDIGASWDRPGPFLVDGHTPEQSGKLVEDFALAKYRGEAIAVIEKSFKSAPAIMLKDPRFCLLLPLWSEALAALSYACRFVFIYRNPLEVAASLNKRDQIPIRRAMQLWLCYNLCCLQAAANCVDDLRVVSFHALLEDPWAILSRILETEALDRLGAGDQIRYNIAGSDNHYPSTAAALLNAPHIAAAIKDMWRLLETWQDVAQHKRTQTVARIEADFNQAMLLAGHVVRPWAPMERADTVNAVNPAKPAARRAEGSALRERKDRVRIIHYHLFKNAGTSLDEMLRRNFGAHWAEKEFSSRNRSNHEEVAEFLRERPELLALSSHTALLPVPELEGEQIIPMIFLRHPIVRISSAYVFERRQDAPNFSSQLAKRTDFAGYVREHLGHPTHRGLKNFQTFRLAFNEPDNSDGELVRARRAIDALRFVGLVEAYDQSVSRFEGLVKLFLPNFTAIVVHKNVSNSDRVGIDEKLERIRRELGNDLYAELLERNRDDIELFQELSRRYIDPAAESLSDPMVESCDESHLAS